MTIDLDRLAHALSDPLRLKVLDLLARGRCEECCSPDNPRVPEGVCACDLAPQLGDISPSRLAYHLRLLRESDLVREEQRGKWVYYTLNRATLKEFACGLLDRWSATDGGCG